MNANLLQPPRAAKLNLLALIGRLMRNKYILTLIMEKLLCLLRDFKPGRVAQSVVS